MGFERHVRRISEGTVEQPITIDPTQESQQFSYSGRYTFSIAQTGFGSAYNGGAASGGWAIKNDFSQVQGQSDWYYKYYLGAYADLLWGPNLHGDIAWVKNASDILIIGGLGPLIHPGISGRAVLAWQAPSDGTVTVSGRVYKIDKRGGDGVTAEIYHDAVQVWSADVAFNEGDPGESFDEEVAVSADDWLYFRVDKKTETDYDSTCFLPVIEYADNNKNTNGWISRVLLYVDRDVERDGGFPVNPDYILGEDAAFPTRLAAARNGYTSSPKTVDIESYVNATVYDSTGNYGDNGGEIKLNVFASNVAVLDVLETCSFNISRLGGYKNAVIVVNEKDVADPPTLKINDWIGFFYNADEEHTWFLGANVGYKREFATRRSEHRLEGIGPWLGKGVVPNTSYTNKTVAQMVQDVVEDATDNLKDAVTAAGFSTATSFVNIDIQYSTTLSLVFTNGENVARILDQLAEIADASWALDYDAGSNEIAFYFLDADGSIVNWEAYRDFSQTQGLRNWRYQYLLSGTYYDCTWGTQVNGLTGWIYSADSSLVLMADREHPGASAIDCVRRWTAPQTGTVRISGDAYKLDHGGGDGVVVTIKHNADVLWTKTLDFDEASPGETFNLSRAVTAGDYLYFITNENANALFDSTYFNPEIIYTDPPGVPRNIVYAIGTNVKSASQSGSVDKVVNAMDIVFGTGEGGTKGVLTVLDTDSISKWGAKIRKAMPYLFAYAETEADVTEIATRLLARWADLKVSYELEVVHDDRDASVGPYLPKPWLGNFITLNDEYGNEIFDASALGYLVESIAVSFNQQLALRISMGEVTDLRMDDLRSSILAEAAGYFRDSPPVAYFEQDAEPTPIAGKVNLWQTATGSPRFWRRYEADSDTWVYVDVLSP